jgi:hypothetical protein
VPLSARGYPRQRGDTTGSRNYLLLFMQGKAIAERL